MFVQNIIKLTVAVHELSCTLYTNFLPYLAMVKKEFKNLVLWPDFWPITLKFSGFRAVVKVHVRAKLHQAECSSSWVIVVTKKRTLSKTIQSISSAQTVTRLSWPIFVRRQEGVEIMLKFYFLLNSFLLVDHPTFLPHQSQKSGYIIAKIHMLLLRQVLSYCDAQHDRHGWHQCIARYQTWLNELAGKFNRQHGRNLMTSHRHHSMVDVYN